MTKDQNPQPEHVIIFVEGDTDELFFKAFIEYYKSISRTKIKPCIVCNLKGVTRYSSKLLAKLQNEYLPEARKKGYTLKTVCCSYDTDVFELRMPLQIDWTSLRKKVNRLGIPGLIQIGVCSSIEDWILDDIDGIYRYLKLTTHPKMIKGSNGNAKLNFLYNQVKKMYQKGYATKGLIDSLDLCVIRKKRLDVLKPLEEALGIEE
jgi:hypothetical protein